MEILKELLSGFSREDSSIKQDDDIDDIDDGNPYDLGEPDELGDLPTNNQDPTVDQPNDSDGEELDPIADEVSEDPDKAGVIRTIKNAHLVYKRKNESGTYDELWVFKADNMQDSVAIKRNILAGTDIPLGSLDSEDGTQSYDTWITGNVQMINIHGLPN